MESMHEVELRRERSDFPVESFQFFSKKKNFIILEEYVEILTA